MGDSNILLTSYDGLDISLSKSMYIDTLERYIVKCNKGLSRGKEVVSNDIYTALIDYLYVVNPTSPLLDNSWSIKDTDNDFIKELDSLFLDYPILNIPNITSLKDKHLKAFKEKLYNYPIDVLCSVKLKGQPIRVIYKNGVIVKAITKDVYSITKDITNEVITILGKKNNNLNGRGVVELRGEIVLNIDNLPKAKSLNTSIKNIYNSVSCLLQSDVSDESLKLLNIVFTDILGDMFMFDSLTSKYQYLERIGFDTPLAFVDTIEKYSFESDLLRILGKVEAYLDDYKYITEGLVLSIDDLNKSELFSSLLLKLGQWKQKSYEGKIKDVVWVDKNNIKVPIALLEESVDVGNGKLVSSVPLYAPFVILILSAYKGNTIYFKYLGDFGAIPTTLDGDFVVSIN